MQRCGRAHHTQFVESLLDSVVTVLPRARANNSHISVLSRSTLNTSSSTQPSSEGGYSVAGSNAGSDTTLSRSENTRHGSSSEADSEGEKSISIVPRSRMKGFVLFAVYGGRRLLGGRLRLAQIDVRKYPDDDKFFTEVAVQYKNLRGFFRWHFSIWKFHTCIFSMVSGLCKPPATLTTTNSYLDLQD